MIKGDLGLLVWTDTMDDPLAITPFDLIEADQENQKAEAEPTDKQLSSIEYDLDVAA